MDEQERIRFRSRDFPLSLCMDGRYLGNTEVKLYCGKINIHFESLENFKAADETIADGYSLCTKNYHRTL